MIDPTLDFWDPIGNESLDKYLEELAERKTAVLRTRFTQFESLQHRLERSIDPLGVDLGTGLYSPAAFVDWAARYGFVPDWMDWAKAKGHWTNQEASICVAPYFDADAPEYPELLHIAVRAWEWAKNAKGGTPKQRVQAFLTERYPALSQGAKDAIAQVVNWNRTGGRPTDSDETGG